MNPTYHSFGVLDQYNNGKIETYSGRYNSCIMAPLAVRYNQFPESIQVDDITTENAEYVWYWQYETVLCSIKQAKRALPDLVLHVYRDEVYTHLTVNLSIYSVGTRGNNLMIISWHRSFN
jgi:hypothetical protein